MHALHDRELSEIQANQSASFVSTITESDLRHFGELALDHAPVHFDPATAKSMGYDLPIAQGFLVLSRFSGLLGMVLPGPRTVIHSVSFKMHKPVFVGDELLYEATVRRISKAVGVVILDLKIRRHTASAETILEGEVQCGFRR